MSPRELHRELEAATLRAEDESDRDLALAWHAEAFGRMKKLESLKTLLRRVHSGRGGGRQSAEQMQAALVMLSQQYGSPLKKGQRN